MVCSSWDITTLPVATLGDSVVFDAGPFTDADGVAIDLTGYTIILNLSPPDNTDRVSSGSPAPRGVDNNYMRYTSAAGELDQAGVWTAHFVATSGTIQLSSVLMGVRIRDVLG